MIRMMKPVHVAVIGVLTVTTPGCQTPSPVSEDLSPAEQEMRAQAEHVEVGFGESFESKEARAAMGAIAGAAIFGLLGALTGSDELMKAGIVGGAALGAITTYYVAKKQEDYAEAESDLDMLIADAHAQRDDLDALIASTDRVIQQNRVEIALLRQRLADGQAAQDVVQQRVTRIEGNRQIVENSIAGAEDRIKHIASNIEILGKQDPKANVAPLTAELTAYKSSKERLAALLETMDEFVEGIDIGQASTS